MPSSGLIEQAEGHRPVGDSRAGAQSGGNHAGLGDLGLARPGLLTRSDRPSSLELEHSPKAGP